MALEEETNPDNLIYSKFYKRFSKDYTVLRISAKEFPTGEEEGDWVAVLYLYFPFKTFSFVTKFCVYL